MIKIENENGLNIEKLWELYSENKDPEIKNQILMHYMDMVKKIVRRIMPKYKEYNESDDLISCGIIGLIDAIEKYDIKYSVKFETYASTRVRGEILDYMRRQDWAPSSLRMKINKINQATEILESRLNRKPTDREIAETIGMSVSDVRKVLEKTHMFNVVYFEDSVNETFSANKLSASEDNNPDAILQKKEMTRILSEMIDSLPEKERTVISLYYYEEMTLKQIAGILRVTESRVSQIHSKVIAKMGHKLKVMI